MLESCLKAEVFCLTLVEKKYTKTSVYKGNFPGSRGKYSAFSHVSSPKLKNYSIVYFTGNLQAGWQTGFLYNAGHLLFGRHSFRFSLYQSL